MPRRSIRWIVSSPRKIDAIAKSVKDGNYDVVIALTGWLTHKVDGVLSGAARQGETLYVRAHKGRPQATAIALARELGLS